jgi:hypothetical protein
MYKCIKHIEIFLKLPPENSQGLIDDSYDDQSEVEDRPGNSDIDDTRSIELSRDTEMEGSTKLPRFRETEGSSVIEVIAASKVLVLLGVIGRSDDSDPRIGVVRAGV